MSAPAFPAGLLAADRAEIARFVHALFGSLDDRGFISLRAFRQFPRKGERDTPLHIEAIGLNLGLEPIIDRAVAIATRIANGGELGVFAPPVCTFAGRKGAKSTDVFEAPTLSVECDQGDLEKIIDGLSLILGERPTIVLHSGSIWTNPTTGELLPKGHLHWKLRQPARGPEQQKTLRRARDIATRIAGGDPTGTPQVHPLRWPGSWNNKSAPPVMARITEENITAIDLADALAALEDAARAIGIKTPRNAPHLVADNLPAELVQLAEWLTYYTTAHLPPAKAGLRHAWNCAAMAIHRATGGSEAGYELFRAWSATAPQFYTEEGCRRRWNGITGCPATWIGANFLRRRAIRLGWRRKSSSGDSGGLQDVNTGGAGKGAGGGGSGGGQEPPEDWQNARPLLGGPPLLLPPPKPGLPAFYPAPTEDTATAKARQDAALTAHMAKAVHLIDLRREIGATADKEIEFFNERAGIDQELTPGERGAIKRRLHREIAEREGFGAKLPPPPRQMFSGAQGTGKTTVARQFAARSPGLTTWITETTFEKSREEFDAYLHEAGPKPPAMLVRGRARSDPKRPGHFMCDRHKAARAIAEGGLSVPKLLCMTCPLAEVCGDHRQRREAEALVAEGNGAVFFLAGNYVFLPAPVPKPHHAILDESLLHMATDVRVMSIAEIAKLSVPNVSTTAADTATTLRAIIEAFTVPIPATPNRLAAGDDRIIPRALAYLRHAQIDKKALRHLARATRKEIDRQTPRIGAYLSDDEIVEALEGGERKSLRQLLALITALRVEIDIPRETANAVWEHSLFIPPPATPIPALGFARMRKLRGLKKAALTVLDGTGRLSLSRKLFGETLENTHIPFDRLAHITCTRGRSYSRQSITAEDSSGRTINHKVASAANLRGDIAKIYDRLPAGSVICASKRVEETLFDSGAVHPDTPSMHFGDLRGRNTWEHYPGGLFVGAENIAIGAAEAMARAFMATDPVPFVSMDHAAPKGWRYARQWPYRATRMRRMRDGTLAPIEVPVHPDPRAQDVLELVREDELLQAIDRLRAVWHRRQLVLLNDLCLDVAYDEIESHKHLAAGGNPIRRAFLATGIVPHTPELLHRAHPTIFVTTAAAEHATRNYRRNAYSSPIWTLAVVRFRRAGQHGPEAKASVDRTRWPDDANLVAAIETFAGPLQSFQGVALRSGATPANAPPMQPNAGRAPPEPRQPGSGAAPPSIWVHGPPDG